MDEPVPDTIKPQRRWSRRALIGVALASLTGMGSLAVIIYYAGLFQAGGPPPSPDETQARTAGWIKARHAGARYLKAMSQAEYPWETVLVQRASTADGAAMWQVTGIVNARNDLGLVTRIPWEAAIIKVGNEFKAAHVKFGDQVIWQN